MAQIFLTQNTAYGNPAIFSIPGKYSMEVAVELLTKLEQEGSYEVQNDGWKLPGYGNLIETGIDIYFENVVFRIMCSYGDIFIYRISGSKRKFYDFCEKVRNMDFSTDL